MIITRTPTLIAYIFFLFTFIFFIGYANNSLKKSHGRDIRIVWYFFSLSTVVTFLVAIWAIKEGAINTDGNFQGSYGPTLQALLSFMLDLKTDFFILGTIVSIIIIPQLITYLLSGISGSASSPLFIDSSKDIFVWGAIKSFAICAGIIFTLSIFSFAEGWMDLNKFLESIIFVTLALLMFSFLTLLPYRDTDKVIDDLEKLTPNFIVLRLQSIHKFCTRNNPKE